MLQIRKMRLVVQEMKMRIAVDLSMGCECGCASSVQGGVCRRVCVNRGMVKGAIIKRTRHSCNRKYLGFICIDMDT